MTAYEFDQQTADRLARIAANPMPNTLSRLFQTFLARLPWRKGFWVTLDRPAALDSLKSVLAVIGAGTVMGNFAQMHLWIMLPMAGFAGAVWYLDYVRHF